MRAIKIDVVNKDVYYVHINRDKRGSRLPDIYKHLDCSTIDSVNLAPGLDMYVDDEGLLRDEPIGAFKISGSDYVFSGHGLMVGHIDGETVEPPILLHNAKKAIIFCDISDLPEPSITVISE
jgi:hypothetical protein